MVELGLLLHREQQGGRPVSMDEGRIWHICTVYRRVHSHQERSFNGSQSRGNTES